MAFVTWRRGHWLASPFLRAFRNRRETLFGVVGDLGVQYRGAGRRGVVRGGEAVVLLYLTIPAGLSGTARNGSADDG